MESTKKISISKLIFTFIYILMFPTLLLFLSGNLFWIEGWLFSLWFTALCAYVIIYLYVNDPALLSERYKQPGASGQKTWDIVVVVLLVVGFTAWIILLPLDAQRFKWTTNFPVSLKIVGGLALLPSAFLFIRVYKDNTYLSGLIRIQKERKQQVVTTGVYGWVRHPMYLAAMLLFIGAPLLMGSWWALGLGSGLVVLIAVRSVGEEKMLVEELQGYKEYQKKVKYRIIPFIW